MIIDKLEEVRLGREPPLRAAGMVLSLFLIAFFWTNLPCGAAVQGWGLPHSSWGAGTTA